MSTQPKQMGVLRSVLILTFVADTAGTIYFWLSNKDSRLTVFLSFLQFVAVFALIWLTFLYVAATHEYVKATQEQLSDQNRPPSISVTRHWYPTTNPFVASFVMEIANPSVRATRVTIKAVLIGQEPATEFCFEMTDRTAIDRVTIPAKDLLYVMVKATFHGIPILHDNQMKRVAALTFEDVFHGTLQPIVYQL
ncbi:MAG: hypothetical protein WAM78_17235 [Candidatus Sulfotelmatobacter sp.]